MAVLHTTAPVTVRVDDLGVVSTMIDGKGPYHFVLDTGAGITVITPEFARSAGLLGNGKGQATGSGGTVQVQMLTLSEVSVGRAEVRNVAAAIIPLPLDLTYQGDYGRIDGVIGYSFLSHFAVTIDLRGHRATFTSPRVFAPPPRAVVVRADFSDATPVVQARADGVRGAFKLDTGDNGDLSLTGAFVKAHGFAARYRHGIPEWFAGVGGLQQATAVRLRAFSLGGAVISDEITSLSRATSGIFAGTQLAGNVGVDVLRRFIFTVEYARGRVDFVPNAAVGDYVPYRSTGMIPERQADGTLRVIAVTPGSAAARARVAVGDTLVAVNGDPIARLDLAQLHEALSTDRVTYTIRSRGTQRNVSFALKDALPRPTSRSISNG